MLEVDGVHTYYEESHILRGVSLEVRPGEAVALLGRNGVGKTTLIRSVVGFTPPRRGTIRYGGRDIHQLPPYRIARAGLALVPQGRRIFAPLSVLENLRIGARGPSRGWQERGPTLREPRPESREPGPESREPGPESREPRPESREPRPESREPRPESREPRPELREPRPESREPGPESREPGPESRERSHAASRTAHPRLDPHTKPSIQWSTDRVHDLFPRLRERSAQNAGTLSGGEQQMLAIGRALMTNPTLIVLDEPSEGLAPIIVREIGRVLRRLKEAGLSILLVEQNVRLALRVADRVYVMSKGQIVYHGASSALDADEDVKRRFLGIA